MRALLAKLIGYGVTGGIAAIVDAGGFALLLHLGLGVAAAGTASFCTAAVVNYALSSRFIFAGRASPKGFFLFFGVALIGLAINLGITLTGVYWLGLPPLLAKIAGIGAAFLVNVALNLRIVFRPSGEAAPRQGTPR
jgi:putative flippase GtrA